MNVIELIRMIKYWMSANDEIKALDKFFILFEQFLTEKADNTPLNS